MNQYVQYLRIPATLYFLSNSDSVSGHQCMRPLKRMNHSLLFPQRTKTTVWEWGSIETLGPPQKLLGGFPTLSARPDAIKYYSAVVCALLCRSLLGTLLHIHFLRVTGPGKICLVIITWECRGMHPCTVKNVCCLYACTLIFLLQYIIMRHMKNKSHTQQWPKKDKNNYICFAQCVMSWQ